MKKLRPTGVPVGLLIGLIVVLFSCCLSLVEAKTKEEIYQEKLAQLEPADVKGHYELGRWCERNKLPEKAQELFKKTIELKPNHAYARRKLGHFKYKSRWTSPEEMNAQGLVKYKGKWVTYDQMMKAKSMIEFEGKWVTRSEKKKLEARARKMEALAKQFPFTGVLDKPGADYENLPWEQARAKETEHFMVKTNLSIDALIDICFLLECGYLIWQDFFRFPEPKEKPKVSVPKNRTDFEKIHSDLLGTLPPPWSRAKFIVNQNHLLVCYRTEKTTRDLLHEGTHCTVRRLIKRDDPPPNWLDEGLATYFESSKVKGKKLVTNLINPFRLPRIKTAINNNTYIKLKDFINRPKTEYDPNSCYPEGWSLVYFLVNGQKGKYKQGFQAYIEAWKKKKIDVKYNKQDLWIQDKEGHIKVFEEAIGVPIDQLEKEWKEYILKLE